MKFEINKYYEHSSGFMIKCLGEIPDTLPDKPNLILALHITENVNIKNKYNPIMLRVIDQTLSDWVEISSTDSDLDSDISRINIRLVDFDPSHIARGANKKKIFMRS